MQTLMVVEARDGWRVEKDGEVIFRAPAEARCFQHALETTSQLFDAGVRAEVVLSRLD